MKKLYSTTGMRGLSAGRQPKRKMNSFAVVVCGTRKNGIWESITNVRNIQRDTISFPYGDFEKVHRCGVLTAQGRAEQYKHLDIENAAAHLHRMIDGRKVASVRKNGTRCATFGSASARSVILRLLFRTVRATLRMPNAGGS